MHNSNVGLTSGLHMQSLQTKQIYQVSLLHDSHVWREDAQGILYIGPNLQIYSILCISILRYLTPPVFIFDIS